MALEKLTKIDGGGISTTSDYRVGVITATKFVGPVEGSITATDASFSGNVSIGGTLTYEDVTNIDSVGLVTARNGIEVSTGTATTALVVSGDARVTGILTVGTGSLTLDGPNNLVNVGTALTLGHTQGLQFHTQNLHSAGFEVNQINTSGIITATGADINGDLDVDGHTNLDNVSIAGVSTFSGDIDLNANIYARNLILDGNNGIKYIDADLANSNSITFRGYVGNSYQNMADFTRGGSCGLNFSGNRKLETSNTGVTVTGTVVATGADINGDLDVDGHANLDNVSIAGVTTFASNVNLGDNDKLIIGDHGDIQIYNDGSKSVIENGGSSLGGNNNSLHIYSQNDILTNSTYSQYFHCGAANKNSTSPIQLGLIRNAGVKAYYNNNLKLETSPNGVDITGGLTVSGIATFNQNVIIPDNKKILFGADDDLQIYHDGNQSYIVDNGTGQLYIRGSAAIHLENSSGSEKYFRGVANGAAELYHDGELKILTKANGATIQDSTATGVYLDITSSSGNNGKVYGVSGTTIGFLDSQNHWLIKGIKDGAVELYHDNDRVFFTETRGVRIGDVTKIYENSTHNTAVIQSTDIHHSIILRGSSNAAGTTITAGNFTTFREYGSFVFRTGALNAQERFIIEAGGTCKFIKGVEGGTDEDIAKFIPDGAVELYHNNSQKLATFSGGISVTGQVNSDGSHMGDSDKALFGNSNDLQIYHNGTTNYADIASGQQLYFRVGGANKFYVQSGGAQFVGSLYGDDNNKIELGNSQDLQIYHNGSDSYIDCPSSGSGHLIIKADDFLVRASNNEDMIKAIENAQVELYFNNLKKLSTTSTGIEIHANEANNANIYMTADEGDDNGDQWLLQSQAATNNFNIYNNTSGSAALKLSIKPDGDVGFYGNIRVPDDKQLKLGAGDDLKLYHRSSDNVSIIQESGSSYLSIQTNGNKLEFWDAANGNQMAEFFTGGGAYLRYGATTRFNTTSTGTKTTGVHEVTGILNLPTTDAGITFGPGSATNDYAHIEWKGGDNSGYLRISVDDDTDTATPAEYIEFGDYATQNRGGTFTQHVKIARSEFLVRTGTHSVGVGDRFKVNQDGNTEILKSIYLTDEFNMTAGGNKNRFIDCSLDDGEALFIRSTQGGDGNHENMALFHRNAGVNLYNDNTLKFSTVSYGVNVYGDIHMTGESNTATNQNRQIYWTGFDKEASGDNTDWAHIKHTTNVHGIAGSVLEIKAENDANDGVALNACDGIGIVAAVCKKFDVTGYIEPSPGGGDNGIKWQDDPYGGTGDIATMQYYQDGSGENTRLRILVANDGDDDLRLEGSTVHVQGSFSAATNKGFRIPHPLVGLTTTTDLVHTAVEGPQADLIYRGRAKLVAGISTVNIDVTNNMTDGTFVNLNRDVQCFTSNETGWTAVKGSVTGNLLTIIAQDNTCTDTISWMVVGERWDLAMYDPKNPMTAENGKIKTEIPNSNYNKGGGFEEDYIHENKYRVGISTFSRPSIENKEVE